jgi:hypothetical protein
MWLRRDLVNTRVTPNILGQQEMNSRTDRLPSSQVRFYSMSPDILRAYLRKKIFVKLPQQQKINELKRPSFSLYNPSALTTQETQLLYC